MINKHLFFRATFFLLTVFQWPVHVCQSGQPVKPAAVEGFIAKVVVGAISSRHYSQYMLDDEIASNLLDEYLKTLDPQHLYFLQSDIDEFEAFRLVLDEFLTQGQVDFFYTVYNTFVDRVSNRFAFVTDHLKTPFDFTMDEEFNPNRAAASWSRNQVELDEIWRLKIKNDLLIQIINGKTHKQAKKSVKQIYTQFKRNLETNSNFDILEIFLSSLTRVYDPHSLYMAPASKEDFDIMMTLSLEGIGASLSSNSGYITISSIIPGGPAFRDGRLAWGDRIVVVAQADGSQIDVINMPIRKVVRYIRGPKGTKVYLHIIKSYQNLDASPEVIEITRDTVNIRDREAKVRQYRRPPVPVTDKPETLSSDDRSDTDLSVVDEDDATGSDELDADQQPAIHDSPDDASEKIAEVTDNPRDKRENLNSEPDTGQIAVINLRSFYSDYGDKNAGTGHYKSSSHDILDRINQSVADHVAGIVIDLRGNSGGSMRDAIDMAGLFIPGGPIVQVRDIHGRVSVKTDNDPQLRYAGPLVVLVDRHSASSSEIFAAAIQDYHRGVVVGDISTHGKGTVQVLYSLKQMVGKKSIFWRVDPGNIKLTTAKFYRVNGESTQRQGVIPDIILESFRNHLDIGEKYLPHALFWDQIDPVAVDYTIDIRPHLSVLKYRSSQRWKENVDYQKMVNELTVLEERKQKKSVPLNLEKRKLFEDDEDQWRRQLTHYQRSGDNFMLQEAINIASDLAGLMNDNGDRE